MTGHARLGPSNHRWPHCPGSVREEAGYPDIPGDAAIDGTGSHELLASCLLQGVRAETYIDSVVGVGHEDKPLGWLVQVDRAERVQMCLDYVSRRYRELCEQFPGAAVRIYAETPSNPGQHCNPPRHDWWGTTDITIEVVDAAGCLLFLEICDYKDGRGWVDEKENTQLISYLAGKAKAHPWHRDVKFRVSIVQPRSSKPVRYVDGIDIDTLESEFQKLEKAAAATDDPNAPLVAGSHCGWCKANPKRGGHCSQPVKQSIEEVQAMTNQVTFAGGELSGLLQLDVASAPPEMLAAIMDQEVPIQAAFDRIRTEIQTRVEQGLEVPGWGMTPGKASRVWASEDEAIKVLKSARMKIDEYTPRQLITPAQAEKLLGKEVYAKKVAPAVAEKMSAAKVGRVAVREKAVDLFADVPQVPSFSEASEAPAIPSFC